MSVNHLSHPTLPEYRNMLGLDDQPLLFDTMRDLVREFTKATFQPHKQTSTVENKMGVREIAKRITRLHPSVLLGEVNRAKRKALRHMIARERMNRKTYYNRVQKERRVRAEKNPVPAGTVAIKMEILASSPEPIPHQVENVIDLTLSDTSESESDPGSKDDGTFRLKDVDVESLPKRKVLTRSRARRDSNASEVILVPIDGAPSPSGKQIDELIPLFPVTQDYFNRDLSLPPSGQAEIKNFLCLCKPSMEELLDCFWEVGFRADEHLLAISRWSVEDRRSLLEKMHFNSFGISITEFHLTTIEHRFEDL